MALQEALDKLVPLQEGSFSDIVEMTIDIPMRYAEWVGTLSDGTRVRLQRGEQLLGWCGPRRNRRYYFQADDSVVCINAGHTPQPIRQVEIWAKARCVVARSNREIEVRKLGSQIRQMTSVDGGLIFIDVSALASESAPALGTGIETLSATPFAWSGAAHAQYNEEVLR